MSLGSAIAGAVTTHSKLVILLMVATTLVLGQGITVIEEDTSLEQFETETAESAALEYAESNFSTSDAPNRTTVQLVATGDDVLSRESLVQSLRFQQRVYANDSIEATLVEDDPIVGLANVVATTDVREEDVDKLDARRDELASSAAELRAERDRLEARGAELEEEKAELEAEVEAIESNGRTVEEEAEHLEERASELEAEAEALRAEADELNETGERLADHLNETAEIQLRIEETEDAYENGDIDETEYEARVSENETRLEDVRAEATADLNATQSARYERVEADVRDLVREYAAGEYEGDLGDLEAEMEETIRSGIEAVLAEEIEALEAEEERLKAERADLEERGERLESLESDRESLEAEAEELEAEKERLEAEAEQLRAQRRELQAEIDELYAAGMPPLDEQIDALESMSEDEFEALLSEVLAGETIGNDGQVLRMVPDGHELGSTDADARMTFLTQVADGTEAGDGTTDADITRTQLQLRELADEAEENYTVVGAGIVNDDVNRSMTDSLAVVAPLALLLVVGTLVVAYRDPLDIVLGVVGIGTVLVWTFGLMGWLGFTFNQVSVAIPVLLIGLSIDYAIHVFMRYRERREIERVLDRRSATGASGAREDAGSSDVRGSMAMALAGLGVALAWVTATTVIGLLSNLLSPIAPIEEFGFVSAVGIVSAFVIFATVVPAAKVELDELLERLGFDRRIRAFGTGGGRLGRALSIGAAAAVRSPLLVVVVLVLVTTAGAAGATQVDTSFEDEHFLADQPPEWTDHLPSAIAPGTYDVKADIRSVERLFPHVDAEAQLLVEGNVTDDETLTRVAAAEAVADESDVVSARPSGEPRIESPLSTMESVAARNESFNETFTAADTTGDGVPDTNVTAVYDELFAADHGAATSVLHRTNATGPTGAPGPGAGASSAGLASPAAAGPGTGEYEAMRLVVSFEGDATTEEVVAEMEEIGGVFEDDSARWEVTVTGEDVVTHVVEENLFRSVLESMAVTLLVVFVFLTLGFRLAGRGAMLAAVTLLPVALSVCWVLGTMYLLGIPFNALTAMVTSLTIGLGIDYCIHVTDRYVRELDRQGTVTDAMYTTVTGTGGALLGSAATAVCGFGVLVFTLVPMLRQFGTVTALSITYAFLASVLVLPTLLVLWTRYRDFDVALGSADRTPTAAVDGGGRTDERP